MRYLLDTNIWLERLLNVELHAVQLVSFDKDFYRTKHGRLAPEAILRQFMTTKIDKTAGANWRLGYMGRAGQRRDASGTGGVHMQRGGGR